MSDHLYHAIEEKSSLFKLLNNWLIAYRARTEAWQGSGEGAPANPDIALIKQELSLVHGMIFDLTGKVDSMSTNIDKIEKAAAALAEDVGLVKTAVTDLRTASDAMKAEIASLKEQIAQGALDQTRLDAAAATLTKVDEDLDAVVLPPAPPPAPVEG